MLKNTERSEKCPPENPSCRWWWSRAKCILGWQYFRYVCTSVFQKDHYFRIYLCQTNFLRVFG